MRSTNEEQLDTSLTGAACGFPLVIVPSFSHFLVLMYTLLHLYSVNLAHS